MTYIPISPNERDAMLKTVGVKSLDDLFDAIRGEEGIAYYFFSFLANTIHTSGALNQPYDSPGKVIVDNNCTILKILTFTENVGCNHDAKFLLG